MSVQPKMEMPLEASAGSLSVAVVIPTKNRAVDLAATLRSLLAQATLPTEVIIIDQSSGNDSQGVVQSALDANPHFRNSVEVQYRREPAIRSAAEARNRAIQLARSGILLFLDDDVELEPEFIAEIVRVYLERPGVTGVSGVITNYSTPPVLMRAWFSVFEAGPFYDDRQPIYWKANRLRDTGEIRVSRFTGALMSFRASAIGVVEFDKKLSGVSDGEDIDFCLRLGKQAILLIAPRARLAHHQSSSERLRDHWLRRRARGSTFLYHKNWEYGVYNRLCYWWLKTGFALMATWASLRRGSLDPWRALRTGFVEGRHGAGLAG